MSYTRKPYLQDSLYHVSCKCQELFSKNQKPVGTFLQETVSSVTISTTSVAVSSPSEGSVTVKTGVAG